LAERRGVWNIHSKLTINQILTWADAHFERTGKWPSVESGPVVDAPEHTWVGVNGALRRGSCGLPGGSSLSILLAERRDVCRARCPLTEELILSWADAHFERTGKWPSTGSGKVYEAPVDNWRAIDRALRLGRRGLPGGITLGELLKQRRRKRG
jgi:hypothetical protein